MSFAPPLSDGLFVLADHHNADVGFLNDRDSLRNALLVQLRIRRNNFVGVPIGLALGDAAAFGIEYLGLAPHLVLDALQNADFTSRLATVSAEMHFGGVRTDHRYALRLAEFERQQIVLVLQQRDGFMRRLQRQLLISGSVA